MDYVCIRLQSKIFVALESALQPDQSFFKDLFQIDCAQAFNKIEELNPESGNFHNKSALSSLGGIYVFDETVRKLEDQYKDQKLIFFISNKNELLVRISFLFGCHMVMSRGLGFEVTYLLFKPWHHIFQQFYSAHGISLEHSLRSFCCAKVLDWIDFRFTPSTRSVAQVMIDKLIHDEKSVQNES